MSQDNAPSPNGPNWFYAADGQTHGPVSISDLEGLLNSDSLTPETMVVEEGGTEWKSVAEVFSVESTPQAETPPMPAAGATTFNPPPLLPTPPAPAKQPMTGKEVAQGCTSGCLLLIVAAVAFSFLFGKCSGDTKLTAEELSQPKTATEKLVRAEYGSRLLDVEVSELIGPYKGKIGVRASFKGGGGLLSVQSDIKHGLETLYSSGLPIHEVIMEAHFDMVDKYGQAAIIPVYRVRLTGEEAAKISWKNVLASSLSEIWETQHMHPSLRR